MPMNGPRILIIGIIRRIIKGALRAKFVPGAEPGDTALTVMPAGNLRDNAAAHQATTSLAVTYSFMEANLYGPLMRANATMAATRSPSKRSLATFSMSWTFMPGKLLREPSDPAMTIRALGPRSSSPSMRMVIA